MHSQPAGSCSALTSRANLRKTAIPVIGTTTPVSPCYRRPVRSHEPCFGLQSIPQLAEVGRDHKRTDAVCTCHQEDPHLAQFDFFKRCRISVSDPLLTNSKIPVALPLSIYDGSYLFELKEDDEACRQALRLGSFYLFHNLLPLLRKSDNLYTVPIINAQELQQTLRKHGQDEKKIEDSVLVGCSQPCVAEFALDLGWMEKASLEKDLDGTFTFLPKAIMLLGGRDAPVLSQAQALLRWHETHQFCSKTGHPTEKNLSGSKRVCSSNGMIYYPQMSPVAITLVSYKNLCLLARQESFPAGMYTALSGFCDIGETLEETVRREVAEEVGLEVESLRYIGSQHWPFPCSSLMVACRATVQHDELNINRSELEDARWFNVEEIEKALQRNIFLSKPKDGIVPVWVPPKWAIAHNLISAWIQEQKAYSDGQ